MELNSLEKLWQQFNQYAVDCHNLLKVQFQTISFIKVHRHYDFKLH